MRKIRPETAISVILICVIAAVSLMLWLHSFDYKLQYEYYGDNKLLFTEDDSYTKSGYDFFTQITSQNGQIKVNGSGVHTDGDGVYITSGGGYTISGEIKNIFINAADTRPVILELDNAVINSKTQPPVYVSKASKVILASAENSENYIIDDRTKLGSSNIDSAVFSVTDITFNGEGVIHIEGNYRDAVKAEGTIKFMSGTIDVIADDDGVSGRIIAFKDGKTSVSSGGDAIRAVADNNNGFIAADGGQVVVHSDGDGLYSTGDIYIQGIDCNIFTGSGSDESQTKAAKGKNDTSGPGGPPPGMGGNMGGPGGPPPDMRGNMDEHGGLPPDMGDNMDGSGGTPPDMGSPGESPGGMGAGETISSDKGATNADALPSMKGIKADKNIYINDGIFDVNSDDDAIHSDGSITIENGNIELASGDDAVHANEDLYVNGGVITVTGCYEGLESKYMVINDGSIHITADDDGINVSGNSADNMMPMGPLPGMPEGDMGGGMPPEIPRPEIDADNMEPDFVVNGGEITIYSDGDGIDINGSCEINGGDIISFALKDGPENAFDFDGICIVNGGSFFGTGNPNMTVPPSDSSKCNSLIVYPPRSYQKGSTVKIVDSGNHTIIEQVIDGSFGWIGLYGEKVIQGETYTVFVNDEVITQTKIVDTVTEIECKSADGQGLPGMQPPPGMNGGPGGPPPDRLQGDGEKGNSARHAANIDNKNMSISEQNGTLSTFVLAGVSILLVLIFLFAIKCIRRRY